MVDLVSWCGRHGPMGLQESGQYARRSHSPTHGQGRVAVLVHLLEHRSKDRSRRRDTSSTRAAHGVGPSLHSTGSPRMRCVRCSKQVSQIRMLHVAAEEAHLPMCDLASPEILRRREFRGLDIPRLAWMPRLQFANFGTYVPANGQIPPVWVLVESAWAHRISIY